METEDKKQLEIKDEDEDENENESDFCNMCLLVLLYILQSIPLNLAKTIPLILQSRGVTYDQQAEFSFVFWPASYKILWAPLVEAIPPNKFGKRKTLIIPIQYTLGILLVIISLNIDVWLGDKNKGEKPNVLILTVIFLACYTLGVTQTVVIDGWAVNLLSRKKIGHLSTCEKIGSTVGRFLGFVASITLDSAEFCNDYIRVTPQSTGIMPFSYTCGLWGIIFIIATTLIAILKKEQIYLFENRDEIVLSTKQSYVIVWEILKLKLIHKYALLMITSGIMYTACIAVAPLKFLDIGIPKEKLAIIDVLLIPVQFGLLFLTSRFLNKHRPMNLLLGSTPYWLMISIVTALLIYYSDIFKIGDKLSSWYLLLVFLTLGFQRAIKFCANVGVSAFNAQISDPRCPSTYVTLMFTITNIGTSIKNTAAIWLVDKLTWKECVSVCDSNMDEESCKEIVECTTIFDGFYTEVIACTLIGTIWFIWARKEIRKFNKLDRSVWMLKNSVFYKHQGVLS